MPKSTRPQRIADLIQRQLAELIKKEVHDPRLNGVTLAGVLLSTDLRHAKIFYTVLNEDKRDDAHKALVKAIGYLRRLLSQATVLRHVPQLQFMYDESIARGGRVASLINDALAADKKLRKTDDDNSDPEA